MAYSREMEKLERQFNENPRRFAAPFADALRKSDEVTRALEVIKVGLELNPEYIPASVILGRCHLDLGDDHAAEAAFSRVLDLDKENVIALKALADIMERQGRTDEAVSCLTYLLEVDRSNTEAREQLARIQGGPGTPAAPAAESPVPPVAEVPSHAGEMVFGQPPGEPEPAEAPAPAEFVEPTALWEPSEAPAASLSSWVEPTTVEQPSMVEPVDSLVEEPTAARDIPAVEGLEGVGDTAAGAGESYNEFFLEREEEIVLNAGAGAEYQVANDSESLLGSEFGAPVPAPPEPGLEPAPEPESAVPAERGRDGRSVIAEELDAQVPPAAAEEPEPSPERESPLEWAMHVSEEREFVPTPPAVHTPHGPDSFDDALDGIAPEAEVAEPAETGTAQEPDAGPIEAPLVVTESMAELYAAQGHPSEALGVYRILYDRNPGNERLRHRIQELESVLAAQVAANAAPSFAASVTGGKPVGGYLGSLLQSRPASVSLPEAPPVAEPVPVASTAGEEGEEALASGAPTRPAVDRLSLGAVFGEDPSPVPPAEAVAKPDTGAGFSFDDFFGGGEAAPSARTSAGGTRTQRAADDTDDLDQFHSWLQSLKR